MDNPFIDQLLDFHEQEHTRSVLCGEVQDWTIEEVARAVLQASGASAFRIHSLATPALMQAITIEAWNTCKGHA